MYLSNLQEGNESNGVHNGVKNSSSQQIKGSKLEKILYNEKGIELS